ncbi:MAG: cobalt-precorrin-5B (C(1))-methyltransferase CbiD, partial [Snowella sp.]
MPQARSGYTLPVFACASAIAALRHLRESSSIPSVKVNLLAPAETVEIAIEQVAKLEKQKALAITRSDPGDNLDLTRDTPIWALVELKEGLSQVIIEGGEGIGKKLNQDGQAAIYHYAQQLFQGNLEPFLRPSETILVTLILPEGKALAERTSNAAFGVVEGLSLLGTTGISQPLSAPQQLETFQNELTEKAKEFDCLVFCVGENGLDLARQMGINPAQLMKIANWLGPLLVAAALSEITQILLF